MITKMLFKKMYKLSIYHLNNRLNSRKIKDHYEVLGLSKKANQKEIKQAFIDLSKLHHPDSKHKDVGSSDFRRISEAYTTLSRPYTKHLYDQQISNSKPSHHQQYYHRPSHSHNFHEQADYWQPNSEASPYEAYYGIKGIKKQPNKIFILFPLSLLLLGFIYFLAAYSFSKHRLAKEKEIVETNNAYYMEILNRPKIKKEEISNFFRK